MDSCTFAQDLVPGVVYWYAVQSGSNTSELFHFTAMQVGQVRCSDVPVSFPDPNNPSEDRLLKRSSLGLFRSGNETSDVHIHCSL